MSVQKKPLLPDNQNDKTDYFPEIITIANRKLDLKYSHCQKKQTNCLHGTCNRKDFHRTCLTEIGLMNLLCKQDC